MQWTVLLLPVFLYLCLPIQSWRSTRIRVLRTDDEKLRYLNHSKVLRENLFFGMRPILYVSRYSCDCQDTSLVPAANLDLPDFPAEDEVLPPPDQAPLRFSESPAPTPKLLPEPAGTGSGEESATSADPDDEEFELLISNSRTTHHVIEPLQDRPFVLSFRSKPMQRRSRRRKVVRSRPVH